MTTGLAVITGTEDRQHAYVALTRGTDANHAYVFATSPMRADSVPGPRAAPELARYDTISAERAGDPAPATPPATAGAALGVLSAVLERDGQQRSATQARRQALADADHLALLHAIWTAETSPAREQRYQDLLAAALPPGYRPQPGPRDRWLWRTLHAAELAGLDPAQVLADAVAERDLVGARDITAVIDTRIRNRTCSPVPLSPEPWFARVPAIADPERRAYVTEIAAMMDARKQRLGEHTATFPSPWAVNALGPVPEHPGARLDWQRRAASIAAWRELSGYHHPADPIGPEPAAAAPDLRAAWHEALAALGPVDGPDVRGMPDGMLLHLRDTYPIETAWAPQYVGDELRQVRDAAWDARLTSLRAAADARAAQLRGDHRQATQDRERSRSYHALEQAYRQRETVFAAVMADRTEWEAATRQQRHLTVAADAEAAPPSPRPVLRAAALGRARARHRRPARRAHDDSGGEDRRGGPVDQGPSCGAPDVRRPARGPAKREDPFRGPRLRRPRPAFPAWSRPSRVAILQPPKPEMTPSPRILQRAMDRDVDWEAAD